MPRTLLGWTVAALFALSACGGGTTDTGSGGTSTPSASKTPLTSVTCSPGGGIEIEAESSLFDTQCVATKAATPFTITFKSRDANQTHNVAIARDEAGASVIFRGDPVIGNKDVTYSVPAIAKGSYFFLCQFHPTVMVGRFIAA